MLAKWCDIQMQVHNGRTMLIVRQQLQVGGKSCSANASIKLSPRLNRNKSYAELNGRHSVELNTVNVQMLTATLDKLLFTYDLFSLDLGADRPSSTRLSRSPATCLAKALGSDALYEAAVGRGL